MGNRSVIDIDINDAQFRQFYELYQQFQGKVGELPEEWNKVNDAATHSHEALAGAMGVMVDSMLHAKDLSRDLALHLKEASEAQKQFRLVTFEGEAGLKKMNTQAKELAHTLFGIGKFLFKLDAAALIGTIGGLFGMDKLASRAVLNQRSARGLGMTTGEYRAFGTDLGRVVDPGMLESIANSKNDMTKQVWLQRASGLPQQQIDEMNPGTLAAQLALKAHDWWASTPDSQHNTQFLQSQGFLQLGMSMDDIRRAGMADREEILRGMNQYARDSRDLNVSDRSTDALYAFLRDLDIAGQKLETVFTNRLAELGPTLGGLMTTLEKDAEILVNDIFSKENLQALEGGIDNLTQFLGSKEFRDDVKVLADGISAIAKAIVAGMKLLVPDSSPGTDSNGKSGPVNDDGTPVAPGTSYWDNPANRGGDTLVNKALHPGDYSAERQQLLGFIPYDKQVFKGAGYENINPATQKGRDNLAYFAGLEKTLDLPQGIIAADVEAESGGNPLAVSAKGAKGAMQLMPSVISQYGVSNPFDFDENVRAGATNLARLVKFYKGDIKKALAASNWGEGNLNNEIKGYMDSAGVSHKGRGDDWERGAPAETNGHIKKVMDIMARNQNKPVKVHVTVSNRAGNDIAASANAGGVQ